MADPGGEREGQRRELRLLALLSGPADLGLDRLVRAINDDPEYEYTLTLASAPAAADTLAGMDVILVEVAGPADLEVLTALGPRQSRTPVVALASPRDLPLAREALRAGAHDYLLTTRLDPDRLVRCIRYCLVRHGLDLTLRGGAFVDELTGLYNRRGFLQVADHQIRLSRRKGRGYTLTFVDIAGLGSINDQHGRPEGDAALKGAAEVLRAGFRDSDVLGRMDGDELVALAIETDDEDEAPLRERLFSNLRSWNSRAARPYTLRLRVAVLHQEHDSSLDLDGLLQSGRRDLAAQPAT